MQFPELRFAWEHVSRVTLAHVALKNVTITLREELVREARHLAVDRGLSLSAYVAQLIEDSTSRQRGAQAEQEGQAREARERIKRRMHKGFDFGIRDCITWTRESLHQR